MKKFVSLSVAILLAAMCLGATDLLAQSRRDVARALEKLDQQLELAKELLSSFESREGMDLLAQAQVHRDKAKAAFDNQNYRLAMTHINAARALLDRATQMVLQGPMQRARDELTELLRRAEAAVIGSGNKEAERLLRQAKENGFKAAMAVRNGNYPKAIEHYRVATFLAQRALDLVEGRGRNYQEKAAEERERFAELLERAKEAVGRSPDPRARKIFEQGFDQARRSQEALDRGDFRMALELYHRATRLLLRAIDIAEGGGKGLPGRTRDELLLLGELIDSAKEQVAATPNEKALILIERAEELEREASQAIELGKFPEAMRRINLGRMLINKVLRGLSEQPQGLQVRIEEELRRVREDLEQLAPAVEASPLPEVQALYQAAVKSADRAEAAYQRGRFGVALEAVLTANRFATAAERMLGQEPPSPRPLPELTSRMRDLDAALNKAKSELGPNPPGEAADLLEQAQEMGDRARQALEAGQTVVAKESLDAGFDLILKSLRAVR